MSWVRPQGECGYEACEEYAVDLARYLDSHGSGLLLTCCRSAATRDHSRFSHLAGEPWKRREHFGQDGSRCGMYYQRHLQVRSEPRARAGSENRRRRRHCQLDVDRRDTDDAGKVAHHGDLFSRRQTRNLGDCIRSAVALWGHRFIQRAARTAHGRPPRRAACAASCPCRQPSLDSRTGESSVRPGYPGCPRPP